MSDVPRGVGTAGATAGLGVPTRPSDPAPGASAGSGASVGERARQVAEQGKQSGAQVAGDVKDTAAEEAQRVAREARAQARNLASDVRDRIGEQARNQNDRLVGTIRQTADQLDEMRADRTDSPAAAVVSRVADGGRQVADYLDRHGPEGVLREVQDFARRRPGAFLATALAAGFVVGRLGKSVVTAGDSSGPAKPGTDAYVSREPAPSAWSEPAPIVPGPAGGTEYAATGTGRPTVVADQYVPDVPPVTEGSGGLR